MKARATRESGNTPDTAGVRLVLQPEPILLLSLLFIALGVDLVAMTDLGVSPMTQLPCHDTDRSEHTRLKNDAACPV